MLVFQYCGYCGANKNGEDTLCVMCKPCWEKSRANAWAKPTNKTHCHQCGKDLTGREGIKGPCDCPNMKELMQKMGRTTTPQKSTHYQKLLTQIEHEYQEEFQYHLDVFTTAILNQKETKMSFIRIDESSSNAVNAARSDFLEHLKDMGYKFNMQIEDNCDPMDLFRIGYTLHFVQ